MCRGMFGEVKILCTSVNGAVVAAAAAAVAMATAVAVATTSSSSHELEQEGFRPQDLRAAENGSANVPTR